MTAPTIGVVVLNHDGGDLTLDCLHSIVRTDWPAERLRVVLVDNASSDDVVERARTELPSVQIVESSENLGFAGGTNRGIEALGAVDDIALVNNDATVEPGWLTPLTGALAADPEVGAACPKILFASRFVELTIDAPTQRRGRGDARDLGVRVSGARVDGVDVWPSVQLVSGFWGREPGAGTPAGEWTAGHARLRVPVDGDGEHTAELRLAADRPVRVRIWSGPADCEHDVGTEPAWVPVPLGGPALDIVNNVGSELTDDGYGVDRGYLQPDDGRFDEPTDVFAWCGGAVLLRGEYLEDVGLFDERLFLYYEDLELSWRGRERGWRYRYVPTSVVRHVHAATSGEASPLKDHFNDRNRLLVLSRHAPRRAVGAAARYLLSTASYARRDLVSPLLHGRRPDGEIVGRRLRAFGGFLRRVPMMRRGPES